MSDWQQAWQVSKIELKKYTINFVISFLMYILFALFLGISFPAYISDHIFFSEQNFGLYDVVFIALFVFLPSINRPKDFRYQVIHDTLWGSPYFIKLMQLSIPEKIIIKSRFLTYFIISTPFHLLFLLLFYIFSTLTGEPISPLVFLSFSIIWLSFSMYGGLLYPASDAGDHISKLKMVLLVIFYAGIGMGVFLLFRYISPYGPVAWTVVFAIKWPVISAIVSIVMAISGTYYWMSHMRKTMNKMDYLS